MIKKRNQLASVTLTIFLLLLTTVISVDIMVRKIERMKPKKVLQYILHLAI